MLAVHEESGTGVAGTVVTVLSISKIQFIRQVYLSRDGVADQVTHSFGDKIMIFPQSNGAAVNIIMEV
jgi:hypothetical protein